MDKSNTISADLHGHTDASDGKQSFLMLLLRAKLAGVKKIAMTDHNTINGYRKFEKQVRYFADKAISSGNLAAAERILRVLGYCQVPRGIEIMTSYKGVVIEVLGYDSDIDILEHELDEKLQGVKKPHDVLYDGFMRIIEDSNLIFDKSVLENTTNLSKSFWEELMKHEENKKLFNDNQLPDTLKKFIYENLYNPESKFFIDMSPTKPKLEEVISMIHKAGGQALLAHPGRYKYLDMQNEIDGIINSGLDGLEVFCPDHDEKFKEFLLSKVREYSLIASGGSDDHNNEAEGAQYKMGGPGTEIPDIPETAWIRSLRNFVEDSPVISQSVTELKKLLGEDSER